MEDAAVSQLLIKVTIEMNVVGEEVEMSGSLQS